MKQLFLGSVALVAVGLGTSAAFAADRGVPAYAPPPPPPPAYTWNGCYVGASAGTSSGSSQHFDRATGTVVGEGTNSFDLSGFIGGGQLGCNWQWGAWVFGIEGDGSAVNKSGQGFELGFPTWVEETQERWFVTARGRLGLTNFWWFGDRTMVYVTGQSDSNRPPGEPNSQRLHSRWRHRIRAGLRLVGQERIPLRGLRHLHDVHQPALRRWGGSERAAPNAG